MSEPLELDEFSTPMDRGMRRVADNERTEFTPSTADALRRRLDEFDRVRNRGAVEARFHAI